LLFHERHYSRRQKENEIQIQLQLQLQILKVKLALNNELQLIYHRYEISSFQYQEITRFIICDSWNMCNNGNSWDWNSNNNFSHHIKSRKTEIEIICRTSFPDVDFCDYSIFSSIWLPYDQSRFKKVSVNIDWNDNHFRNCNDTQYSKRWKFNSILSYLRSNGVYRLCKHSCHLNNANS
jgi:hypothetical protein